MQRLYEAMYRLLDQAPVKFHRYLYDQIKWDNHMLGIVGPRGVGKTTLMLQHLRESHATDEALYVSADNLYFTDHSLFNVAEDLVRNGGRYFYIDEVHKYPEWSRELKAMYDSLPGLHVFFTGSSVLDIEKGQADLSRRAPKYVLQGLSFREYLAIVHGLEAPCLSLDEILGGGRLLSEVEHPLPLFKDYLRRGYYPFGTDLDFETELEQVIVRTLESDIPQFAEMTAATGRKLLKLMSIVSTLAPFKPNMTKLASQVQASRNSMEDYLLYMEKAGMIAQLRTGASGLGALGKVEKIYLDNPNIMYVLGGENLDIGNVRETFFFNQMRVEYPVTASGLSDFEIQGATFEVGGKNKIQDQIKDVERGYVVKDDIEYGHGNVVPLWAFGLTY